MAGELVFFALLVFTAGFEGMCLLHFGHHNPSGVSLRYEPQSLQNLIVVHPFNVSPTNFRSITSLTKLQIRNLEIYWNCVSERR